MARITLQKEVVRAGDPLPPWWAALFATAREPSFFLTPAWVATWLDVYGGDFTIEALRWTAGETVVAGCLLARRRIRLGPVPIDLLALNTAGEDAHETPFVEFNDVLCAPGAEEEVLRSLADALAAERWHQFLLAGVPTDTLAARLVDRGPPALWSSVPRVSPFVDLARVRRDGYDRLLSANTRSKLRRSIKSCAERGPLTIAAARDLAECLDSFEALVRLHQRSWTAKGKPGAFASERMRRFHRALIERTFVAGESEILRVRRGDEDIGYLYNFLFRGKVYFYQSGLVYDSGPHSRPGLVAHDLAVRHYADRLRGV